MLYRPPDFSYTGFLNTLEQTLIVLLPQYDEIFCLGDFNIDVLKTDSLPCHKLTSLLEAFNFKQVVDAPTRVTPNSVTLIDLIITNNDNNMIQDVNVINWDH